MLTFTNALTFERRCTCPPERIVARRGVRTGFVALPRRIPDTPSVGRLAGECFALVARDVDLSVTCPGCGASTLSVLTAFMKGST